MIKKTSKIIKKVFLILWIALLITGFTYYTINPEFFTPASLKEFFEQFWGYLLVAYFIISALRGFTLIPSSPFVLVGVLLFPDNLPFVYIISLFGILLSSTMIYFFSREMGFEEILLKRYGNRIKKYEHWIQKHGFLFVAIWSFLIIVPTDLICYIAGTLKMQYTKFITAVALWEALICIILVFGWERVLSSFGVL